MLFRLILDIIHRILEKSFKREEGLKFTIRPYLDDIVFDSFLTKLQKVQKLN